MPVLSPGSLLLPSDKAVSRVPRQGSGLRAGVALQGWMLAITTLLRGKEEGAGSQRGPLVS
jgi:hypothetical protein